MVSLTVIITTYKRPLLLRRALESVLDQSFVDFRVCVYDNASGDETGAVVSEFRDGRIEYHCHEENIGMMSNYQFAFQRVTTPYFCFLSDDDFLLPGFYESAMAELLQVPEAAFWAGAVRVTDTNNRVLSDPNSLWPREGLYSVPEGLLQMTLAKGMLPIPTGIIFNYERVKHIQPDWGSSVQLMWDPDYLMRIASEQPFIISKKPVGVFLAHDLGYSASFYDGLLSSAEGFEKYMLANRTILSRLITNPSTQNYRRDLIRSYNHMMNNYVIMFMKRYIRDQNFSSACSAYRFFKVGFEEDIRSLLFFYWAYYADKIPLVGRILQYFLGLLLWVKRKLKQV